RRGGLRLRRDRRAAGAAARLPDLAPGDLPRGNLIRALHLALPADLPLAGEPAPGPWSSRPLTGVRRRLVRARREALPAPQASTHARPDPARCGARADRGCVF